MANLSTSQKADINVRTSVNTDTVNQDVYMFGDQSAPLILNNGIERDGGVTNVYETEIELDPNSTSFVTLEGDMITKGWDGLVTLKEQSLGYVSPYSVQDMCSIKQVDDVVLSTVDKTYITVKLSGNIITINEYDIATTPVSGNPFGDNEITYDSKPTVGIFPQNSLSPSVIYPGASLYPSSSGTPLHSLSITVGVTGITNLSNVYTSLSIVRSSILQWTTCTQFVLRIGPDVYLFYSGYYGSGGQNQPLKNTNLLQYFNQLNYLYVYQYENSSFLVNLVGNVVYPIATPPENRSYILPSTWTTVTSTIRAKYCIPQYSNNKTRHLFTCDPLMDGTRTKSMGLVGYTDFTSFSSAEVWPTLSSTYNTGTYTAPLYYNTGMGYSEYVTKTTASANYTNVYTPAFITDAGDTTVARSIHSQQANNTSLLWNYYGKLNNMSNVVPTRPLEFRVNWINGTQGFLSAALLDSISGTSGTKDQIGVILTEIDGFDDSFLPQIVGDNTILYKGNDNFYVVAIDYDAGAGYFNSAAWSEAAYSGLTMGAIVNGVISGYNNSATASVTLTLKDTTGSTISLKGGAYRYIKIRYKTTSASPWTIQYANSGGTTYDVNHQKTMSVIADGNYHILTFDMSQLDTGATDWKQNFTTAIRILPGTSIGATWSIFSCFISYKTSDYVPQVQRISDAAYKLNTLSPLNIVNIRTGLLELGSVDYHGQMSYAYTGTQAVTAYRTIANMNGIFSNSFDTGEKITNADMATSPYQTVIDTIGTRLTGSTSYSIDVYAAPTTSPASIPIYQFSTKESQTELIDPTKVNTPYQANIVIPVPLGYRYKDFAVYARSSTIFTVSTNPVSIGNIIQSTSIGYDGYDLGNSIPGTYVPFYLLGTKYIQDLSWIYIASFSSVGYFNSLDRIAPSIGMNYVGSSPTEVYFVSTFDNSIYTFNGNRSLIKTKRFSQTDAIINGLYSTKDNTLLMNATNSYIWTRDGIVTINAKKFAQSGNMTLFETRDGLIIMNDYYYWAYTYNYNGSIVPLQWQHAHFGIQKNQKSILSEFVFTMYNTQPTVKCSFTITVYSKDENDNYLKQIRNITMWPMDFNPQGYATFRIKPSEHHSVATSIKLQQIGTIVPKIVLMDVVALFADESNAVLAARKSR